MMWWLYSLSGLLCALCAGAVAFGYPPDDRSVAVAAYLGCMFGLFAAADRHS